MRYIAMQKHPAHVIPILPAIERIFPLVSGQAAAQSTGKLHHVVVFRILAFEQTEAGR